MTASSRDDVALLEFDPAKLTVGGDTDVRAGLSAVAVSDGHLWLACDEGCRIDRFTVRTGGLHFDRHTTFELDDLLKLPAKRSEEADIEGMDVDNGWLWLVGSHSVKRKKARPDDAAGKVARKLEETERDGNRHLLARIPLDRADPRRETDARRAGALPASPSSSALLDAITEGEDPHLAPFVEIPGKDNGFDIEGLAARGLELFLGLRGPVLREWCCILELHLEPGPKGGLGLTPLDGRRPYRKHFLKLGGLGVRDLVWLDDDLLILAGPSMAHDGPTEIWRWKNVASATSTGTVDVNRLLAVPHGEGRDRAEGIALLERGRGRASVLVVFDSPSEDRLVAPASVRADVYRLP